MGSNQITVNGSNQVSMNSSNEVGPMNGSNQVTMNGYFFDEYTMNCACMNGWNDEDDRIFNGLDSDVQDAFALAVAYGDPDAIAMNGLGKWLKKVTKKASTFVKDASKVVTGVLKTYAGLSSQPEVVETAAQMDTDLRQIGITPNPQIVVQRASEFVQQGVQPQLRTTDAPPSGGGTTVSMWEQNKGWILPVGGIGLGALLLMALKEKKGRK